MRYIITLIVFILSINLAPTLAQASCWVIGLKYREFELLLSQSKTITTHPVIRHYHGTELISASGEGSKETVELLIAEGANVNAYDSDGFTALMIASGRRGTLKLLNF